MTSGAVHQFVSSLSPHDAVSAHALRARDVLRGLGLRSEIFVKEAHPPVDRHAHFYAAYRGSEPAHLLYHAAIGSPLADFLLERPEPKIVDYHNVTPARFFEAWEPFVALELRVGRHQVEELAPCSVLGIGDSDFNAGELRAFGYARTTTVPILLDLDEFERELDQEQLDLLVSGKVDGGADWLFVGRLSPNKAQHDLLKAFAVYRRAFDPAARLHLVGSSSSWGYELALRRYVEELGLDGCVQLTGSVSAGALAAHYHAADVFVCLSEHEGFCVPLLEAMHHRLPVVAFAAGAVPETLAGAGVLLDEKSPARVAAAVRQVVERADLRRALVDAGVVRLRDFSLARTTARFAEAVTGALEEAAA